MKKEVLMNMAGVILFYLLIIFGVIAINARLEVINDSNNNIYLSN